MPGVCAVDPVSISFEFLSETCGAEGSYLSSDESVDEYRITSVSKKKLLVTGFFGFIQNTVSSDVFESEESIVKYLKMISVLRFIRLPW